TIILYWTSSIILFLFEGVMPALTSQTELAKEGIRGLGYPEYFGTILLLFKIAGSILLILKFIAPRLKEWVYAGFSFDFVFAGLSTFIVYVLFSSLLLPIICLLLLAVSYTIYPKLRREGYFMKPKLAKA